MTSLTKLQDWYFFCMHYFAINFCINAQYRRNRVYVHTQDGKRSYNLPLPLALNFFAIFKKNYSSNILILRTHIDILRMGKYYQLSQLRQHDAKIQTIHAEHYRDSDNLFLNKYFYTIHIDNQPIQRTIF